MDNLKYLLSNTKLGLFGLFLVGISAGISPNLFNLTLLAGVFAIYCYTGYIVLSTKKLIDDRKAKDVRQDKLLSELDENSS